MAAQTSERALNVMLTTAAAAKRVRRDRRTIERWIARGLPTTRVLDGSGQHPRHLIAEEDLVAWLHKAIGAPRQPRIATRGRMLD